MTSSGEATASSSRSSEDVAIPAVQARNAHVTVFLGPSCPLHEAMSCLAANYRPAARRGDLLAAAAEGASTIALVDGRMVDEYAPDMQECASVIASGVSLVGTASLGAIRATELGVLGMVGHGWVFASFASGLVEADDEVVVLYDPDTTTPFTVPLVQIRYGLSQLLAQCHITEDAAARTVAALRALSFAERSPEMVQDIARACGIPVGSAQELASRRFDIKRRDTLSCLRALAKGGQMETTPVARAPALELVRAAEAADPVYGNLRDRLRRTRDQLGITRIAITTGLDRLRVHTASASRPGTSDRIWVYSGKGLTQAEAEVKAVMESVERVAALWDETRVRRLTPERLSSVGEDLWLPQMFTERRHDLDENEPIAWTIATCVQTGARTNVPAELVFCGNRPTGHRHLFLASSTTGLAAGATRSEAIERGLAEVIERDVVSCAELRASHRSVATIVEIGRLLGLDLVTRARGAPDHLGVAQSIEIASLPSPLDDLSARFESAAVSLVLKAIPSDIAVPVFAAAATEEIRDGRVLAAAGYGCHWDPVIAARSALLELAQSRATDLQASREDSSDIEKSSGPHHPGMHWLASPGPEVTWPDAVTLFATKPSADDGASWYLKRLRAVGLARTGVVELPCPDDLHAVRVLVPGTETWHATAGTSTLGPRMAASLRV
jgi:ribosomal protein S12 methylthiotransferase accessory factor YcaO